MTEPRVNLEELKRLLREYEEARGAPRHDYAINAFSELANAAISALPALIAEVEASRECEHNWRVLGWVVTDSWNDHQGRNVPNAWQATHLFCSRCQNVVAAPVPNATHSQVIGGRDD